MENSLSRDNAKLKQIISLMPGNVFWKDAKGKYLGCNNNVAKALNLKSCDEIIGKVNHDLFNANLAKLADAADHKVITEKKELTLEEIGIDVFGKRTIYLTKKIPLFDEQGNVNGILGISFDILERKKMEENLEKAKKQAEEANELKSQFMVDIQHDLKTPCIGITEMTNLLAQSETNQKKKEILQHVAQASARLLNILNDILAFGQAQSGKLPIIKKKFEIKKIIDDVFPMEKTYAAAQKIELKINYRGKIPPIMIGDEQRIARVLLNIVNNAIKFTPKGYVSITVKAPKIIDKRRALLQVVIKDTGIGIPKNKLQHIYGRFVRVTPANTRKFAGTGLGLSVAKLFMDDIGGEIKVKSVLKKGSAFTCTFPIKLPLAGDKVVKNTKFISSRKQKLKILLVEDDILTRTAASTILKENFTHNLDIANSGKDAIEFARKNKYDVIFMDIGLPDITGYDTARKIRELKTSKNKKTIIVALTAHNAAQEKKDSFASGINAFLTKPLNIEKMTRILQKLFVKNNAPGN